VRFQSWTGSSTRSADGTFSGTFTITFSGKCVDTVLPPVQKVTGSTETLPQTTTESKTIVPDIPIASSSPSPPLTTPTTTPSKLASVPAPSSPPPSYAPLSGSPSTSSPLFSIAEQDSLPQNQNADGNSVTAGQSKTRLLSRGGSLGNGDFPTGGSSSIARTKPKISSAGNTLF